MSEQTIASEIKERINKLTREKRTLNTRLSTLNRESNPELNTRNQRYLTAQIDGTRTRLTEIDQELKEQKQLLNHERNIPIERISKSLGNLSVTSEKGENRLKNLEEFISRSAMSMFTTPPAYVKNPRVIYTPQQTSAEETKTTSTEPIDTAPTSQRPKQLLSHRILFHLQQLMIILRFQAQSQQ